MMNCPKHKRGATHSNNNHIHMTPQNLLNNYEKETRAFTKKIIKQFEAGEIDKEKYLKYYNISLGQEQAITDFRLMFRDIIVL